MYVKDLPGRSIRTVARIHRNPKNSCKLTAFWQENGLFIRIVFDS